MTQRDIAQTICARGYARRVRPPVAFTSPLKRRLLRAYGLPPRVRAYELDHLVPLELGGAPRAVANLWPEPRRAPLGSAAKDAEENLLHRDVCAGRVSLAGAQRSMTLDWVSAYERDHRHGR